MQCPSCLEDLKTQLEGDSIPEEDIINPQLVSGKTENQVTSYKPDQDKFIEKPGIYVEIIRKYILRKKKVTTNKNNILAECIDR